MGGRSLGALKVLDLNEKYDNSLCPGWPQSGQEAGSSMRETGRIISYSFFATFTIVFVNRHRHLSLTCMYFTQRIHGMLYP